jgi:hypothetical protein
MVAIAARATGYVMGNLRVIHGRHNKMLTLSFSGQAGKGQKPARKRIGSKLMGVGLGAMMLTVLGFLPGCGSDSAPGGSVKGKNAKPAARAEAAKPRSPGAPLIDLEGTVPGKIKKQPDSQHKEVLPGITQEALDAKLAEARQKHLARGQEVFPGITQEALEAKLAESRQRHLSLGQEVFPGITQKELEAKLAEARRKHDPRKMMLPGKGTSK